MVNVGDFILEANRILKPNGILKIVEVRSRFEKESEGIKKFLRTVKKLGFSDSSANHVAAAKDNRMFFELECTKVTDASQRVEYSAAACVYKKR